MSKLEITKFLNLTIDNLANIRKLCNKIASTNMTKSESLANLEKIKNLTNITDLAKIADLPINELNDHIIWEEISYFPMLNNRYRTICSLVNFYKTLSIDAIKLTGKILSGETTVGEIFNNSYTEYSKKAYELSNIIRDCFVVEMKTYARNPRADAISSTSIFKLLKNKSKESIILKPKDVYPIY